jgi:predicted enzyme related to lactoylglutathione lyase
VVEANVARAVALCQTGGACGHGGQIMAGKVVHFEIPIDDGDRAVSFYGKAFGWDLEQFGPIEYWTTTAGEGDGIGGALTRRNQDMPSLMFYIAVDDVDEALAAVEAAGGTRLGERMPIPGVGWSAFFQDTEGNKVGLFQADPDVPMPEGGMPG